MKSRPKKAGDDGLNTRGGRVRRRLGFAKKIGGEERAPLALMFLALYRQTEIYKRPLGGGGFYMPLQWR
jgi:hypothetical protein